MKIYVGNLPYDITEQDLRREFESFGVVDSISIINDKYSGRPKGFAFVDMASKSESINAISGLNGKELNERAIIVNEARPRTEYRGGGFSNRKDARPGNNRQRRY